MISALVGVVGCPDNGKALWVEKTIKHFNNNPSNVNTNFLLFFDRVCNQRVRNKKTFYLTGK
jgi:hypothetical protein